MSRGVRLGAVRVGRGRREGWRKGLDMHCGRESARNCEIGTLGGILIDFDDG